jgi:hypothetical protein
MASKEPPKVTSGSAINSDAAPTNEKQYNRRGGRGGRGGGRINAQNQAPKIANLFKGGIAEITSGTMGKISGA